jgi:hypothetical protein
MMRFDAATKERIEGLVAEHSIFHSRCLIGYTDFTQEERAVAARTSIPSPESTGRAHCPTRRTSSVGPWNEVAHFWAI